MPSFKRLPRSFFERTTLDVARDLLGKYLVYRGCAGKITEAEAYIGEDDPACHAARGLTPRTKVMYGPAGHAYVYFIYGMYYCLNIVTEKAGFPAAVLIRAVEPVEGISLMQKRRKTNSLTSLANGPGKICQAFGITKKENGVDLCNSGDFYMEDRGEKPQRIRQTTRIGINVGQKLEWRFLKG